MLIRGLLFLSLICSAFPCSPLCLSVCLNATETASMCLLTCDSESSTLQRIRNISPLEIDIKLGNTSCTIDYSLSAASTDLLVVPKRITGQISQSARSRFTFQCQSRKQSIDVKINLSVNSTNTSYQINYTWTVATDCSSPTDAPPPSDTNKIIIVASTVGGVIMIILIVLLVALYLRKQPVNPENLGRRATVKFVNEKEPEIPTEPESYRTLAKHVNSLIPHELEFPSEKLEYESTELGNSTFGKIYKGEARHLLDGEETTFVLVEILEEIKENDEEMTRAFTRRLDAMAGINHAHAIQLLGVVSSLNQPMLIFESPESGENLKEFLARENENLTVRQKINYVKQISEAMAYFEQKHYVHRDLATRNCYIMNQEKVKILPFGIITEAFKEDYHKVGHMTMLPIRWLPNDAIVYGKFTIQTDVFAFGVVLWEVFSQGALPYGSKTNEEVLENLKRRELPALERPDNMPDDVHDLMVQCWKEKANTRPSFSILCQSLKVMAI